MSKAEETNSKELSMSNGDIDITTSAKEQVHTTRLFEFTFDGDKTKDLSLKEAVVANIIVGIIALAIYFPIEYQYYSIFHSQYYFHVLLTLICFVIIPIIYMTIINIKTGKAQHLFIATKKGVTPRKVISSLIQGLVMHAGIFFPWILLSQMFMDNVNQIKYFLIGPGEWATLLAFFAINVIVFEFYSKSFIQIQFMEAKGSLKLFKGAIEIKSGKWLGFVLQNIAWLGGHVQEFFWLQDYIGVVNSAFFIIVSGVLTGITVMETENIFGVTVGHVLLNILIVVTYAV